MTTLTERDEHRVADRTDHRSEIETYRRRNRVLTILVVLLAAVLAAAAAWIVIDDGASSETAVTDEIQQLLDDYLAAWNDWDGDAYLELVTEDARHVTYAGTSTAQQQARLIDGFGVYDWQVEAIGDAIMQGDGPWYVAQANRITANTYPDGREGLSTLTIVDDDGTLKISRHVYVGAF